MEFTDYMLWKAAILVFAAFCWGIYCGLTGRPLGLEQRDNQTEERRDS